MSHHHLWIDVWLVANIVMLFHFLCCFVIVTSAFPEGHIDSENVTVAAEHGVGGRIAGGDDPDRGARAAPFQAQITREGATFCSGTIVSDRYIVTAAHCVEGARPRELTVRIGSNIRGEGLVVPIEEIVQHPDYDSPQNNFDIAYMRTGKTISTRRTIRSAFIASTGASVPRELHVTGWGYQEDNQNKLADNIRAVDLPVISNTECQVFYPMMTITKNMICLYNLRDTDKGTCVGDGGDPATVSQRLVGVSSATRGCGPGMAPSVFTYVDAEEIRSFILNGISGKTSSKRPEKPPGEHHEKAPKTPAEDSDNDEQRPGDASMRPEKPPGEHNEKAPKTPAEGSDNDEQRPGDASKRPEKPPGEHHEKAPKTPAEGSNNDEQRPGDASKRPEKPPGEHHEKAPKTPAEGSDYDEQCPGDASKRPEKTPGEHHEKAPKTPAEGSDYDEQCPGDASKRPEKTPGEHHEKAPKTPAEGSDYDEQRPGDTLKRPSGVPDYPEELSGDLLSKRPEEVPADRPEELSKGLQRQPADRPRKRPADREP